MKHIRFSKILFTESFKNERSGRPGRSFKTVKREDSQKVIRPWSELLVDYVEYAGFLIRKTGFAHEERDATREIHFFREFDPGSG